MRQAQRLPEGCAAEPGQPLRAPLPRRTQDQTQVVSGSNMYCSSMFTSVFTSDTCLWKQITSTVHHDHVSTCVTCGKVFIEVEFDFVNSSSL